MVSLPSATPSVPEFEKHKAAIVSFLSAHHTAQADITRVQSARTLPDLARVVYIAHSTDGAAVRAVEIGGRHGEK